MLGADSEPVQPSVVGVNCYEWRKQITGSVSVDFIYSETGDNYTLTGSGTITHGPIYTGWTRRELQCLGMPFGDEPNWILRGPNLCEGRAELRGILTAANTIPVTFTPNVGDPVVEDWLIFWQIAANDYEVKDSTLLPVFTPYPDWENDPYSMAYRAQIDASTPGAMLVGIAPVVPLSGSPSPYGVPIRWLKNGESGTSGNGFLNATVSCSFTIA